MAKIEKFEDIQSWQRARELCKEIYAITSIDSFSKDYGLKDQIRRAGISVMSNIAEGFERNGNKEFKQHLSIAKASLGEIESQLYIAFDQRYISNEKFEELQNECKNLSKIIGAFIEYLKTTNYEGTKFSSTGVKGKIEKTNQPETRNH
jgi:four helix bundle protein